MFEITLIDKNLFLFARLSDRDQRLYLRPHFSRERPLVWHRKRQSAKGRCLWQHLGLCIWLQIPQNVFILFPNFFVHVIFNNILLYRSTLIIGLKFMLHTQINLCNWTRIAFTYSTLCSINPRLTCWHVWLTFSLTRPAMFGKWCTWCLWLHYFWVWTFLLFRCSKQPTCPNGIRAIDGKLTMSFKSIFQDVRNAFDWVHVQVCPLII